MKILINLLPSLAIVFLGSSAFGQSAPPEPGKYYRLQFKTSTKQYLRIGNNGVAGGSTDLTDDGRSDWLFIPTGEPNEYWIFSKGAQDDHGQALNFGDYAQWFGQWDFTGGDRQRFRLDAVGDYYRLVMKYKRLKDGEEAVSTRWNAEAFAWKVNPDDDAQLFRLVERDKAATPDDKLVSYLFWNTNNEAIQNYFYNPPLNWIPKPQELRINQIVFLNRSAKIQTPAIHHFGCGGSPSRDWKLQCWSKELQPLGRGSMNVDNYLRNAEAIWGLIGSGVLTTIAGVLTAGAASAVVAAAKAATWASVAGAAGLVALDVGLIVIDVYDFTNSTSALMESDEVNWINTDWSLNKFGVDENVASAIYEELGRFSFAVKGESYKDLMQGWYVHETVSDKGLDKMFYGGGKAVFVLADYQVAGNWKADGQNKYLTISKSADEIIVTESGTLGGATTKGPFSYMPDPEIPNLYTNSENDSYTFTSYESFTFQKNDGSEKNRYQRIYDLEGDWKHAGEQVFLSITKTATGLGVTKSTAPGGPPTSPQEHYERGSYANVYKNPNGDIYTLTSRKNLEYLNKDATILNSYKRLEYVSFQSSNYPDRYIRHKSGFGWIDPILPEIGTGSEYDFYFTVVPGLADPAGVSIMSSGGSYFRHQGFRISLHQSDGSQLFKDDATFFQRPALDGSDAVSFESKNYPGYYLRHIGFALFVNLNDDTPLFAKDASFTIVDQ
jgi:hypothetical protein